MSIFITPTSDDVLTSDVIYSPSYSPSYSQHHSQANQSSFLSDYLVTLSPVHPLMIKFDDGVKVHPYVTIDNLPHVRRELSNYYYDLTRDKWLLDELNDILNYLKYEKGKVRMIKNAKEYNPLNIADDSDKTAQAKVKFIENTILSKYDMYNFLDKFTDETNTKWVELPHNEYALRQALKEYLMKKIRKRIMKK